MTVDKRRRADLPAEEKVHSGSCRVGAEQGRQDNHHRLLLQGRRKGGKG